MWKQGKGNPMAARQNPKREKLIEKARKIATGDKAEHLDPLILFGRASNDDLEAYTPEMLELSTAHAARRLIPFSHPV